MRAELGKHDECDEFGVSREEAAGKLCKVGEIEVRKAELLLHEVSRSREDRMRTHSGAN